MSRTALRPANIAFGAGLVEARKECDLSLRDVASRAKISASALSGFECGERAAKVTTAAVLLNLLGTSTATRDHLLSLIDQPAKYDFVASTEREMRWLRFGYEQMSLQVTEWSPMLFPSALRSDAYSRELRDSGLLNFEIESGGALPKKRIRSPGDRKAHNNSVRIESEPRRTFLIGEAATRPDVCSLDVLRGQLEEVALFSGMVLPNAISFVPADVAPPGLVEPFTIYEDEGSIIAVATPHRRGTVYFTDPETMKRYEKVVKRLRHGVVEHSWI